MKASFYSTQAKGTSPLRKRLLSIRTATCLSVTQTLLAAFTCFNWMAITFAVLPAERTDSSLVTSQALQSMARDWFSSAAAMIMVSKYEIARVIFFERLY